MPRHVTRRTMTVATVTVAIGVALGAVITADGTTRGETESGRTATARVTAATQSPTRTESRPFGPILPPRPLSPDSPAGKQYLQTERDLHGDPLEARSFAQDQIEANFYDRGLSSIRVTGPRNLTVTWKGRAPRDIRASLTSRPFGIDVRLVEGAVYSRTETARATQAVVNHPDARTVWMVSGASGDGRGTGIEVYVTRNVLSDAVKAKIAKAAGIPLTDVTFRLGSSGWDPL